MTIAIYKARPRLILAELDGDEVHVATLEGERTATLARRVFDEQYEPTTIADIGPAMHQVAGAPLPAPIRNGRGRPVKKAARATKGAGRGGGRGVRGGNRVPCPDCGQLVKPQGMGPHRRQHAGSSKASPRRAAPAAQGKTVPCPDCGGRFSPRGLKIHQGMRHSDKAVRPAPAKGTARVCPRCQFATPLNPCPSCGHRIPDDA